MLAVGVAGGVATRHDAHDIRSAVQVYWEPLSFPAAAHMHALNAFLGRAAYTWPSFVAMCDAFDRHSGRMVGLARRCLPCPEFMQYALRAMAVVGTPSVAMTWVCTVPADQINLDDPATAHTDAVAAHVRGVFLWGRDHAPSAMVWTLLRGPANTWLKIHPHTGVTPVALTPDLLRDVSFVDIVFTQAPSSPRVNHSPCP